MYLQDVYQVKLLYQQLCTKVRQPKMKKIKKTMQRFPNEKFFSRNQFHEKFRENDFTKISTRNLNFFFSPYRLNIFPSKKKYNGTQLNIEFFFRLF